jgi:hypothetical protein
MTETIRIETMHTETGLTAALADFVAGLRFADLPAEVVHGGQARTDRPRGRRPQRRTTLGGRPAAGLESVGRDGFTP